MSTRGTNFLFKWISNNIHETDDVSVAELTEMLFADAKTLGFSRVELRKIQAAPLRRSMRRFFTRMQA
jgi:hypothetical protein